MGIIPHRRNYIVHLKVYSLSDEQKNTRTVHKLNFDDNFDYHLMKKGIRNGKNE